MINCHTHIFTDAVVPENFLPFGLVRFLSRRKITRRVARILQYLNPFSDNDIFERFAHFLEKGAGTSQEELFNELRSYYPDGTRFVILPMDMEYMGCGSPSQPYTAQLDELYQLKQTFGDIVIPFVAADPRRPGVCDLVKRYIDEKGFGGIKLYPALGYFPYDERLRPMWKYAEDNRIPVTAHVSKIGIFYRGKISADLFAGSRIGPLDVRFLPGVLACNYFTHPLNYRYLLNDFPKLKICLGHCGGDLDWNRYVKENSVSNVPDIDKDWLTICMSLMRDFDNCYTDISFTMDKDEYKPIITSMLSDEKIRDKILFGSDFYLVQLKDSEPDFINSVKRMTGVDGFAKISETNPEFFLKRW
jgi:uncharacterized protein